MSAYCFLEPTILSLSCTALHVHQWVMRWIKKAWLQIRLCASAVTAWPVSSMQHPNFFEGFRKWIILLPSWFECLGCVQSMLEGTGRGYCFITKRFAVSLQRMPVRFPLVLFLSAVERRLLAVHQDLRQRGHFGSSHPGAVGEPGCLMVSVWTSRCWEAAGTGYAAVSDGSCYPERPCLWSLTSRGYLRLSCPWK